MKKTALHSNIALFLSLVFSINANAYSIYNQPERKHTDHKTRQQQLTLREQQKAEDKLALEKKQRRLAALKQKQELAQLHQPHAHAKPQAYVQPHAQPPKPQAYARPQVQATAPQQRVHEKILPQSQRHTKTHHHTHKKTDALKPHRDQHYKSVEQSNRNANYKPYVKLGHQSYVKPVVQHHHPVIIKKDPVIRVKPLAHSRRDIYYRPAYYDYWQPFSVLVSLFDNSSSLNYYSGARQPFVLPYSRSGLNCRIKLNGDRYYGSTDGRGNCAVQYGHVWMYSDIYAFV